MRSGTLSVLCGLCGVRGMVLYKGVWCSVEEALSTFLVLKGYLKVSEYFRMGDSFGLLDKNGGHPERTRELWVLLDRNGNVV